MTAAENTTASEDAYAALSEEFVARGATRGSMFGRRALKRDGHVFVLLQDDALACSLGAGTGAHTAALALPGAYLFDPSRRGRPFKDWVSIPIANSDHWPRFAAEAFLRAERPAKRG
jgi:hypothetical protein